MPPREPYDAVIVGSGAGGGMAALVLASRGLKVLMLEAGRDYDPYRETPMFAGLRNAPLRGAGTPDKEFGFFDATVDGGWEMPGEPYTSAPGSEFMWWRSRMLGGRTNHWARNSFRMGPYDFKPYSRDGLGVDWPITYEDLAPWYDKTETLVGVNGSNDGLENHPDSSPGVLHDPPAPRVGELFIQAACRDLGIPCVPARRAVLTRPIDNRSACFNATDCGRGCSIGAAFQTTTSLLPMAMATGNLTIVTDAMVYEVRLDEKGRAEGVGYIDKTTGKHETASGRAVVLAASAGETARILLNSRAKSPDGVANSSGQVGRNLMDTVGAAMEAQFPLLENRPAYNEDGTRGLHLYIPFWLYGEQARGELDFPRSYHYELGADGRREPGMNMGRIATFAGSYGKSLKEDMRRYYGSFLQFVCRGEMIPNEHSWCEIDPAGHTDRWGIPTLRFHFKWSDHELNMVDHFQKQTRQIIDRLGGQIHSGDVSPAEAISKGGQIIHEVGTTRMGDDPDTSVTNQYGQAWDVENLFITDGGVFASKAHKNPTLTIMALAWRSSDFLAEQLARRSL